MTAGMRYQLEDFLDAVVGLVDEVGLPSEDGTATKAEFLHLVVDTLDQMGDPRCVLCGVDTDALDEYYMVTDELWGSYGVHHGQLCIGCLEERLGRRLTEDDFTDVPLNTDRSLTRSARLTDRLSSPGGAR